MSDAFDLQSYLQDFLTESSEHLATLDDALLDLERLTGAGSEVPEDLINALFRAIHTLKGMAGMMGFSSLTRLAHEMEQTFDDVRQGKRTLNMVEMGVLFEGLDAIKLTHGHIEAAGSEDGLDVSGVLASVSALARGETPGGKAAAPAASPAAAGGALDLLARVDAYDQVSVLVDVAKGSQLYNVHCVPFRDCGEVELLEWHAGLGLIGKVLGTWAMDERPLAPNDLSEWSPNQELVILLMTDADRQSVLDCTGVPESSLIDTPLPWASQAASAPAPAAASEPTPAAAAAVASAGASASVPAAKAEGTATSRASVAPKAEGAERATSIRVETTRLDRLMELVGELVIHHTRLAQLSSELSLLADAREDRTDVRARLNELSAGFEEAMQSVGRVSDELQEGTMRVRMVQVSSLFNRFPRILRDLARECGKAARLEIVGGETELDKTVIEQIGDPLIHLIRNAIDHGLETPSERAETGKPAEGVITLAASQQGNNIVLVVSDDGRGIDRNKIFAKALERGLVAEHDVMTDSEVYNLIFRPGFSTAEKVTNISGRGVGMDVVLSNIKRLGGSVTVDATLGLGTRFIVKLPLTLAITKALLVRAGGHTFAIQLASVDETLRVLPSELKTIHEREVLQVRGSVLPVFRLGSLFDLEPIDQSGRHLAMVVVSDGEERLGLVVDGLVGQQDVVVKSLGEFLGQVSGIGGATILGDGRVALIVDVHTLLAKQGSAAAV